MQMLKQKQKLMLNSFMLQLPMLLLQPQWHTTSILPSAKTIQRGNARRFLSRLPARWLFLSVFLSLCRSLSRYLCRSVVRYQGKCASQYTRRFQGSTVPLDTVIIEDTGREAIFINLYYCYKLNTK